MLAPTATDLPDPGGPASPGWPDVAVAVVAAVAALVALALSDVPGASPADLLGAGLLLLAAAGLVGWRARPAAAVVWVSVASVVYLALGYPGGPASVVTLVALYGVAVAGHRRWTLAVVALFVGGGLAVRLLVEGDAPVSVALDSALYVLVSLLGDAIHTRRRLAAAADERLRLVAAERDAAHGRRLADQRLEVAREVHDVVAHTVTLMAVQAGAAADAIDDRPDAARAALLAVRDAADGAMHELRSTIGVLRRADGADAPRAPAPTIADLDELCAGVAPHGLDVTLRHVGQRRPLGAALELTAYRVVQEALTNVVRHADTGAATVTLHHVPDVLEVCVHDDGAPRGPLTPGHGLTGLTERVEALGGTLTAGPHAHGGFCVTARLPVGGAS